MLNETTISRSYKNAIVQLFLILFLLLCEVGVAWLKTNIIFVSSDLLLVIVVNSVQFFFLLSIIGLLIRLLGFVYIDAHKPARPTENDGSISEREKIEISRSILKGIGWILASLFALLMAIFSVDPQLLTRMNYYMVMFGFKDPFSNIDMSQLNLNARKGKSNMNRISKLIVEYGERFSTTFIYVIFAILSLVVAVILFGILKSTGIMTVVFAGYVREAEFSGAFAGFLVTLIFLVKSYNSTVQDRLFMIKGNVYSSNNKPIEGAIISIVGDERKRTTNDLGWFEIRVDEQNSWDIVVESEGKVVTKTIRRSQARTPVVIRYPKENQT